MLYLLNPTGAVVEIPDEEEYELLLKKGFSLPTPEQVGEYERVRALMHQKMTPSETVEPDVYFVTVSPAKNGYGVASQKLMQAFDEFGVKYSEGQKGQKIGFLFHQPYSITRLDNPVKIIYTMFESDKIPVDWKEYLEAVDLILVPSHWCMEVFAQAGFNAQVVPLGYDDTTFKYYERRIKRDTHETFYFLHYDAFNIRKGHLEVFKAFLKAFQKDEPVKLILKTARSQSPWPISPAEYPNIVIETGEVSDFDLARLCERSDAFVFPSRGEGFGVTPLEAMATGLPTIVPNAHGISEYFNPEFMYEAPVSGKSPAVYQRYKGQDVGMMVKCDVDKLAAQMRFVYEHEREAKEKGKAAAEYVKQWTFKKTAAHLKRIFDEYLAKDIQPKPLSNVLPLEEA